MDVRDLVKQGRVQEAMSRLRAQLARKPNDADALFMLGQLLLGQRRTRGAERCFNDLQALWPEHAGVRLFLGECLRAEGRIAEAEAAYRAAMTLSAADAMPAFRLASLLHEAGRVEDAREAYRETLARDPAHAHAHNNLAALLVGAGELQAGLEHYAEALRHAPGLHAARLSLASISTRLGQPDVAATHYRAVLAREAGNEAALRGLGTVLLAGRQTNSRTLAEAEACWRRLVAQHPGDRQALANLAVVLVAQSRHAEAVPLFERVIGGAERRGGDADFVVGTDLVELYAQALAGAGRKGEAIHLREQLCAHNPDSLDDAIALVGLRLESARWDGLTALIEGLGARQGPAAGEVQPRDAIRTPGLTLAQLRAVAAARGATRLPAVAPSTPQADVAAVAKPAQAQSGGVGGDASNARLRVGYVSADLGVTAAASVLAGVFERHDRASFEIFAYRSGEADGSAPHPRFEHAVDAFRDVRNADDAALVAKIRDDRVDILVDLSGWSTGNRLSALAARPAPLQAGWFGFPGTVGVPGLLDYIIGDKVVTPLAEAGFYAETIAQLPHCCLPNDDARTLPAAPARAAEGLSDDALVLCCFNPVFTLNPAVADAWAQILQALPTAVLWLLADRDAAVMRRIEDAFAERGVARERIVWAAPKDSTDAHLARLQLADLALDTWPYNAGAAAADALWAGVPLVSLRGEVFTARTSESQLRALGLERLVAADAAAYVRLVVELATDPEGLRSLRTGLRRRRKTRPLFDTAGLARDLERLYQAMWRQHQSGERVPISLAPV